MPVLDRVGSAKSVQHFRRNVQVPNHLGVTLEAAELALDEVLPDGFLRFGELGCAIAWGGGESGDGLDDPPLGFAQRRGALGHDLVLEHGRPGFGANRPDEVEGVL